jgi:uncharacterized protein (DUF1330 family)
MVRMVALIRINNLSDFNSYRKQVPLTLEPYGGELRFRWEKPITLDDENGLGDFSQIAFFRFPTQEAMTHWYESDAYHDLLSLRASAGTFTVIGMNSE